jgi:hypothetical protein
MSLIQNDLNPIASSRAFAMTWARDSSRTLLACLWSLAAGLGAIHAWADRFTMGSDGISYLDIGDAFMRRDWDAAISAYWPPLYSVLLGLANHALEPTPYWEFPVAHLVNFVGYLLALGSFHFFLNELLRFNRTVIRKTPQGTFSPLAWRLLAYSLFLWSSLELIGLTVIAPDIWVTAAIYLACAFLLRSRRDSRSWLTPALLGAVLGIGYLAKAVMFPLAFIFLGANTFSSRDFRTAVPRVLVSSFAFLLLAGPFIAVLSLKEGRFTYSDKGKFNYAQTINGVAPRHWRGWPPGSGTPVHPTRKIFDNPVVYEFARPIKGTYPPWYDPTYWRRGLSPFFDLRGQLRAISLATQEYLNLFLNRQTGLISGFIVIFLFSGQGWSFLNELARQWRLLLPVMAGIGVYWMLHVETRYIAPFVVLFWLSLASSVRLPNSEETTRRASTVAVAVSMVMFAVVIIGAVPKAYTSAYELLREVAPSAHVHWRVADGLRNLGVQPQDQVAIIGQGTPRFYAHWARLARVKIVAEIPSRHVDEFLSASDQIQAQVLDAFAAAGATMVVAHNLPREFMHYGWQPLGKSGYFAYSTDGRQSHLSQELTGRGGGDQWTRTARGKQNCC